ncbi:unnamed protein product [Rhizoctonia solani]|uniref:Transmembrane protein n=1 Tax=Rhizoctonia solani TaxID=456999 RepID=A0A8H2WAD2_9AGAM|nr:unnamed protein product [Rhizoctonia solani]
MSFTPQRAGPSSGSFYTPVGKSVSTPTAGKSISTPTSQSVWSSASPQTTIPPARASSALLPSPPKESRWTEHIIPEDGEDGVKKSRSNLGLSEPLARMGRSSLPAHFDLTDPRYDDQDDTVRPEIGRQATNRNVRIIQQPQASHLQVPAQSYSQPESRGTTPMPMRPSSQLELITYGGRPRVPRFNAPGLDLRLTRDPGLWSYVIWRFGLPIQLFAPIMVQLFLDFCSVYVVVQAAAEPTYGRISNRQNWSLAAAAYCACVAVWILGIVIMYELVYSFWRRWRVKRPAITPLYLSTPGRHYASLASYDVFCFFRSVQRAEIDYVPEDEHPLDRGGAKGRAGNRSRDMLSSRFGTSMDMLSGHRRSDSGGELLQMVSPAAESSGIDKEGVRAEGMRRRSVGRAAGDDLVGIQPKHTRSPSDMTQSQSQTHTRSPSTQTRFQELVYGPGHPPRHAHKRSMSHGGSEKEKRSLSDPKSKHRRSLSGPFTHRRSMSGRTSSEVERALELTPVPSRRVVSGSSYGSSSVGFVIGCIGIFLSPTSQNRAELWYAAKHRLAEFFYARAQSVPTLITLLPRAGISAAALFGFWNPPVGGGGVGVQFRDGAFFNTNGTLTGFSRGTLLANVALALVRLMIVMTSLVGLWVVSGQGCAGLCGPRYRWEEEGEWDEKGPTTERDELGWEWRTHARERVQDAYELCTVRRQSWIPQPPTPHALPGLVTEKDKGKQPESGPPAHQTPRPAMDTFGSTFGAGVVKERNSDQELALSMPGVRITPPPVASKSSRRALSVEMFDPLPEENKKGLVPPSTTTTTPSTFLPFPLAPSSTATTPRTMPLVLQSPLVTTIRQREMSSSGRSAAEGSSTARGASTPRTGPSTSTLDHTTPRAATKLELESVSSRDVVEEGEEEERSVTVSYEEDDEGDKDQSHSGDRSYDSYADNFSLGEYAHSQTGSGSVRIRAAPPPGSEPDTSGSYSENFDTTSASLSSLGQPISTRFFPISFPRPGSGYSPGGNSGSNGHHTDSHRSRGSAYTSSHIESPRPRRSSVHDSILSHGGPDSILSHGHDSLVSRSHGSSVSFAQDDSIVTGSHGQDDSLMSVAQDSLVSSPARSQRSGSTGLIPPPPPNPNHQRRRRAGTAPSVISAESIESLGALRRRVESHTVRPGIPAEFGGLSDEGFEAEREDSVGMLSAPSSRKNSLVAIGQRARRGRVSSGSGSSNSRGTGSTGSRAVSGASGSTGSRAVSGGSAMSGVSRQGQSEDEGQDHTFGIGTSMWRRGATPLRQRHDSESPVPEQPEPQAHLEPTTHGPSTQPFPRHSIGASSTSANPEGSTIAGSFVTAARSFVSSAETEHD